MTDTAHQERNFEAYVVKKLQEQGWLVGTSDGYDQDHALYPEDLWGWLEATDPKKFDAFKKNGDRADQVLMEKVAKGLKEHGTIKVLRSGFSAAGYQTTVMSDAKPEDHRDPSAWTRYRANRLRVVPQLKYKPGHNLAIDLVLFINGIPVATVEIKTDFTQSASAAVEQYRSDRLPVDPVSKRVEPLLSFKRGAVVHFAMSDSDIQMATKLDGENTFFLPFNKGNNGHAGNAAREDGEYPVAYFWEEICQKDAWLRIFHSFVYVEKKKVVGLDGRPKDKETLIFPRFHQWDAVNKMIADAESNGPGLAYLCEHSAGSGKTSTIAWTAHDLIRLRRPNGDPVFNTAIVVTDRTVLDSQLQDAVQQIDHQADLIRAIDREKSSESKSAQLAKALKDGTPIIVVTIQTFPYAMEAILTDQTLKGRNFAVIIDEAHTSQTGTSASKLQAALALDSKEAMANLTVDELLEKIQKARGRPKNISHFAFTATPKHSTMMLFGRTANGEPATDDNLPVSFHRYTMRQAIEEGFILDVMKGYMPYRTAFNLSEKVLDKKRVDERAARRTLARWMNLHATNVSQKVQFIVEHFSHNVAPLLGGRAKAMVVTSSRAAAVRYKKGFDRYIEDNSQYRDLRALVAFSGKLTGKEVMHPSDDALKGDAFIVDENDEFTESSMNPGTGGQDLRIAFDSPQYQVMIVADKFQTGFDQPKLVAMYLDKKIANDVEIVQTLSRLNRTAPGKDATFVIDFVNDPAAIQAAFRKYDQGALIEQAQDPDVVYTLRDQLDEAGIYNARDIDAFQSARYRSASSVTSQNDSRHKALYAATQRPTDVFNARVKSVRETIQVAEAAYERAKQQELKDAMAVADERRKEHAQELKELMEFKSGLARFSSTYAYIAQLIDFGDPPLETFAAFAKLLSKRLNGVPPENVDLAGLVLTGYDIKPKELAGEDPEPDPKELVLRPIGPGGSGQASQPVYLREIVGKLNALFGEATPLLDQAALVNQVAEIARQDSAVMAQVENNPREDALRGQLKGVVEGAIFRAKTSHAALAKQLLSPDRQAMEAFTQLIHHLLQTGTAINLEDLQG